MGGSIFLKRDEGELVEMKEQAYESEELLQRLLEEHPNLLAGDQIDSASPRRWLLITREMGVPSEEQGGAQWSLDHLFLDQDAIPTLIEVKRSSDTRIRREVVGQMLDYAANAVVYWPVEEMRAKFESRCEREGRDPYEELAILLGAEADVDVFWEAARTNLRAGKIRLAFVADKIPPELRRIVEFLSWQMDPTDVVAVEIKQFADPDGSVQTLVPRVVARTERLQSAGAGETWTEDRFFAALHDTDPTLVAPARRILEWSREQKAEISWGHGRQSGSFTVSVTHQGVSFRPVNVWTNGPVGIQFAMLMQGPFESSAKRLELMRRLNDIPGVDLPEDSITKFPSFRLSALTESAALDAFLTTLGWVFEEIKAA